MNKSIQHKLEAISDRFEEITALLADAEIQSNQNRFRELSQEYSQIEEVVGKYRQFQQLNEEIDESREMLEDPEMAELAQESIVDAEKNLEDLEPELQKLLIPRDPNDNKNIFLVQDKWNL